MNHHTMNQHTIEQRTADILSARDIDAIANPVNCVGIMGKGLAIQFAQRFPEIVRPYERACRNTVLRPGKPLLHDLGQESTPRWIVDFPTKDHWRNTSQLEWIETGLQNMYRQLREVGAASVGLPALGAGLGGLPWQDVLQVMERHAQRNADIKTVVFLNTPLPRRHTH